MSDKVFPDLRCDVCELVDEDPTATVRERAGHGRCRPCRRLAFLTGYAARNDAEEAELQALIARLEAMGRLNPWPVVVERE